MDREILRTRTSHPHHTSTSIVWGQRHEAQAEAGGSPRDCRVCSCAMATGSPGPRPAPDHTPLGQASCTGLMQPTHTGVPLPPAQGGASEMRPPWAGLYQGLSKPPTPTRDLSQMQGDRSDRVLTTHASQNSLSRRSCRGVEDRPSLPAPAPTSCQPDPSCCPPA